VESTFNWYWLVDGLQEHGYDLQLVNTAAVKQYDGLKYSAAISTNILEFRVRVLDTQGRRRLAHTPRGPAGQ